MNLPLAIARPTRSVLAGLFLVAVAALAVGWAAGTASAAGGSHAATPTAAPRNAPDVALGAPGAGTVSAVPQVAGGMAPSIAYPVPGYGSLGVAPEGTILTQGTGTSAMKVDGSDRATALKKATDAALADARVHALAAAGSMGVGLKEIYSVSVTSSDSLTYTTPDCLIQPLTPDLGQVAATGSVGAAPASPPSVCFQQGASTAPVSAQLVVTLVVAYKFA
jgi:hypothetical protein